MNQPLHPYAKGTPFEVQDTPEFRRILNLPRREWEHTATQNDLHKRITQAFKMPGGEQELRPIQAAALADAHDHRGLLAPIRVGEGKTLLTYLLPTVLQNIQRPVLLLDAALVDKTWKEFKELQKHWVCHPAYMNRKTFDAAVITYQLLGRDSGKDKINNRRPDLIIADEVHMLRNRTTAACTKRVERFMWANPETIFCGMSGTVTNRSIRDYWHLLRWSLRHMMPLPMTEAEMERWAEVLDEKKIDAFGRRAPGVLLHFCTEEERAAAQPQRTSPLGRTQQMPMMHFHTQLRAARQGYQRRFRQTPGIVCSPDKNLACSLVLRRCAVYPGDNAMALLENLRSSWETPNGDLLTMPSDIWRQARELACGFWYRWDPPAPERWLNARRTWNWNVRQVLSPEGIDHAKYAHLALDSPMQVALAVTDGRIDDPAYVAAYEEWDEVRSTFKINSVPQWVDEGTLNFCLDWMRKNRSGIVWTEHRAFGQRLAEMLGTGFCANGGVDAQGRMIEDYDGRPVVASVAANHKGRNLQAWSRNLIVTAKPTGSLWEQLLGRTHRSGQKEDTVYVDWVAACEEQDQGFTQVLADARYIQDTTGQSQKVLYADRID